MAVAQEGFSLSGRVVDADTEEGVAGAVVEIVGVKNPEQKRYYTTEYGGYFRIVNVPNGDYKGSISFIGYGI